MQYYRRINGCKKITCKSFVYLLIILVINMMYCIQYSTLAPLLIKVILKGKSDDNLLDALRTPVSAFEQQAKSG